MKLVPVLPIIITIVRSTFVLRIATDEVSPSWREGPSGETLPTLLSKHSTAAVHVGIRRGDSTH